MGLFKLSDSNPNDLTGGGGCICAETKQTDCKAPFIVCYGNEMFSVQSPHVVACANCVGEMRKLIETGEQLSLPNHSNHPSHEASPASEPSTPEPKRGRRKAAEEYPDV